MKSEQHINIIYLLIFRYIMTKSQKSWKSIINVKDINGTHHVLELNKDEDKSIIDLAEEKGVELPRSCRSGACFSCCATVTKWKEYLDLNKTWEMLIDVDEDEVLTCICWVRSWVFESGETVEIDVDMLN